MKKDVKQITITTKDGKPIPVPPEGSLGLLALGHIGLIAWRQARHAYIQHMRELEKAQGKAEPTGTPDHSNEEKP
jgi:hypothetical protein